MSPNTLHKPEESSHSSDAATPPPLDTSVEQLEALMALAAATTDGREVGLLLEGLADTITRFTDYRTCIIALVTDEPPYQPRVLSYSRNVPPENAEVIASGSYPRVEIRRLIDGAVHIEVGGLGFAAYFPPSHYPLLDEVFPQRFKTGTTAPEPAAGAARWHDGDELFVPLSTREGEYVGLISLDDPRTGRAPDRRSVLPVVAFARQVSQLLERQRDADALAQQVEREAIINRITLAVRRSLNPEEVFHAAVEEMGVHLVADRCTLYTLDEEGGVVRKFAEYDAEGVVPAGGVYPVAPLQPLIDAIKRRGILTFADVAEDPLIRPAYDLILKDAGTRSIMYAAVYVEDETRGAFAISSLRERPWKESDVALARAVADQTGIAIRQAELYQRAESTSAREALINRLSHAVRATLNLPEVLHTATHELGRALRASRVYLRPYDPAHETEAPVEHEYLAPGVTSVGQGSISYINPLGQFLTRRLRPLVVSDAADHYADDPPGLAAKLRAMSERYNAPSMIFCPVVVQGRFRAGLCIHQTEHRRRWTAGDVALVEAVAAQLAVGIAQAELFEMVARGKQAWEATFDAMSDGVFIFDNTQRLIRVNHAGAAMESSPPQQLLGRRCCDILRTDDPEGCLVERVAAAGRGLTREYTPEGLGRPLIVTVAPLRLSDRMTGTVCTVRDISELRQVERLARERQSLLENVLESARESICALDPAGRFMWCNSGATTMTGYAQEHLIGRHFMEIVDPADEVLARKRFALVLGGEPQTTEARFVRSDGQVRYSFTDTTPLVIDGHTIGVLAITRDVTDQRQERERAAQADKLRALGQLASGVAHDFNNALAAIIGRAQLLRRTAPDTATARGLDVIRTAAEDAAATVRRIRAFARPAQGEQMSEVNVTELLRDSVEITRTRWENEARARGLTYEVSIEADTDCTAHGNASELREVFVNLIVNAVDAMPRGGRLAVRCRREAEALRVNFADTGAGMTEEVRQRIFEPFYTTKGASGTGLGLFVSYGIIERHGGQIAVESEPNRGSTFMLTLPRACVPAPAAEASGVETGDRACGLRVLVVDDEDFVRETLVDMLDALGHTARAVRSGRAALDLLDTEEFDVVFSDLSMPEMDGWELAREIRRRHPLTHVCIVTGYGRDAVPPDAAKAADAVIGKPFNFDQVEETLAAFQSPG